MRSIGSRFEDDAYNPAEDDARWEAYRALMRKTGEIKVLPGLDDEAPDDTWRADIPIVADADGRETNESAQAEPTTEHLSYAPALEVAAQDIEVVARNLDSTPPRSGPRGRQGLMAAGAAMIALVALAAANVMGPRPGPDMRSPAPSAPASHPVTTGVVLTANAPVDPRPGEGPARTAPVSTPIVQPQRGSAKPLHHPRPRPVKHHRASHHPAKRVHTPTAVHGAARKTWASPYQWADKRWDGGIGGGAAQPRP